MFNVIGLFCEDIREEKSGQASIVGILPDNVNLPPHPSGEGRLHQAVLPKLALYVRIHFDPKDNPGPMKIVLVLPDGTESTVSEIDTEVVELAKKQSTDNGLPVSGIVNQAVFSPFRFPAPGTLTAVLITQTERHTCAVLKFIVAAPQA